MPPPKEKLMRLKSVLAACAALGLAAPARADLPVQHVTIAKMMPDNGHRLYVMDYSLPHGVDGKEHVIDGDDFRVLGQITNGQMGTFNISADGKVLYNATTFFSRGDHGTYTNVLEFYDPQTLLPTGEIVLGQKRAQSTGVATLMPESAGGKYLFVQNVTPASSVSIIDLAAHKMISEIPLAGCYGIYPSVTQPARFSTLCGDGAVVTVGFNAKGAETSRKRSAVFFDPDKDPLFITAVQAGKKTLFISFLGVVHDIDMTGATATQGAVWPVTSAVPAAENWRPGGTLPIAYNDATKQLYIAMHDHGFEGSHKFPATEIWKVDIVSHKVETRGHADGAVSIAVSAGPKPLVFTVNGPNSSLSRYDGQTLAKLGETKKDFLEGGGPLMVQ
jgi:methylamine dehydrogenase heavy chain